jgi:hypothetical protein
MEKPARELTTCYTTRKEKAKPKQRPITGEKERKAH